MTDLVTQVKASGVLSPADRLVVGVSGGPDSVALLHVLNTLRESMALRLHAVHVHHGLRGSEADADAKYVGTLAEAWNIPFTLLHADVPALAKDRKLGIEEAARQARYTHLAAVAHQTGATKIAVAHNADDQSETVLMHFIRGSGLAGLRGMRSVTLLSDYHLLEPLSGPTLMLIRPLLDTPRADIEAYCAMHNLEPRFDRSNLDTTYFRNRLRHEVLPLLAELNPGIREVLRRTAGVVAVEYDTLESLVDEAWHACLRETSGAAIRFRLEVWRGLPLSMQRATLRRAVWHLRASLRDVSFVQIDSATTIANRGNTGAQATLPDGLLLRVGYDTLTISEAGYAPPVEWPLISGDVEILLTCPGAAELSGGWRAESASYTGARGGAEWQNLLADRWSVALDAAKIGKRATIRARRPGDRFQPQGIEGSQKVSAFMINAKIPAQWRGSLPLLLAADGRVAWVAGWRVDGRFAVSEETQQVLIVKFYVP